MEGQRFKKRKKPNYKRGIILVLLLLLIIFLWFNIEDIITGFLNPK